MDTFLQQLVNGLTLGAAYAVVALGYTMVYGIINLINFAHGEVLMVGALTSWTVIGVLQEYAPGLPGWLILLIALICACVVAAALNFAIEKIAYRPLRNAQDFERFIGELIDITLKAPMGESAAGMVSATRKKFRGTLEKTDVAAHWQIVWSDAPAVKPGQKVSKKRAPLPTHALGFTLDELREARLAPVVDFKGRKPKQEA